MSVFANRNINGKWVKVEVTDPEIIEIEKNNFKKNIEVAKKCLKHVPSQLKDLNLVPTIMERIIPIFIEKMSTPLHYAIENYVDEKLSKDSQSKELL